MPEPSVGQAPESLPGKSIVAANAPATDTKDKGLKSVLPLPEAEKILPSARVMGIGVWQIFQI